MLELGNFNFQPFKQTIKLPYKLYYSSRTLLMCNYDNVESMTELRPYEGRIYQLDASPATHDTYACRICGYMVDIPKDEGLPDDFSCPLCKHGKEEFVKME